MHVLPEPETAVTNAPSPPPSAAARRLGGMVIIALVAMAGEAPVESASASIAAYMSPFAASAWIAAPRTLTVEKLTHKAEATLSVRGAAIHADATNGDMYAAIDALADKLDRRLARHRDKRNDHHAAEAPRGRQD